MSTYEPIASQTLGSAAASVTFSSIPQGYTDLVIVMNGTTSTNENTYMRYNSDSSSLYSVTYVGGDGSTASSGRASTQNKIGLDGPAFWTSSQRNQKIIQIQNYSNATTFKTNLTRSSSTVGTDASVGLYRSTSAITSITFLTDVTYSSGSTFSIYGIQVGQAAQKAQGGNIVTTDGTYVYHTFTSSGAFIPSQALIADVLVVAGGGGGGGGTYHGGGGGAGGYLTFSSQSFATKSYTCLVGAGGAGGVGFQNGSTGGDSQLGSLTLVKGGGSGSYYITSPSNLGQNGGNGGSGGGASGISNSVSAVTGGSPTSGQGYAGGGITYAAAQTVYPGGGGGGAGAVGDSSTSSAVCNGGIGAFTAISGGATTGMGVLSGGNYYFAGGGGGSRYSAGTAGQGGTGGGGNGGDGLGTTNATSGLTNTGGGGGGAERYSTATGGAGGSGIVIIRYAI